MPAPERPPLTGCLDRRSAPPRSPAGLLPLRRWPCSSRGKKPGRRRPPPCCGPGGCGVDRPRHLAPWRPRWTRTQAGTGDHHRERHRHLQGQRRRVHRRDRHPHRPGHGRPDRPRPSATPTPARASASTPARVERGAAWSKKSKAGKGYYLSVLRDDRSMMAPSYASLVTDEQGGDHNLIWSRVAGAIGTEVKAAPAKPSAAYSRRSPNRLRPAALQGKLHALGCGGKPCLLVATRGGRE